MTFSPIFQRQVKKKIHLVTLEEVNWWAEPSQYLGIQKWKFIFLLGIILMPPMFLKMPQLKFNRIALFMRAKISNIVSMRNLITSLPLLLSKHYRQEKNSMQLGLNQTGHPNLFLDSLKTGVSRHQVKLVIQWATRFLMFKELNQAM